MSGSEALAGGRWVEVVDSRPWGWFGVFAALVVLLVGGMLLWWAVFGFWDTLFDPDEPFGLSFDARSHLTLEVLLAFVAACSLWLRRGVMADIRRLGDAAGVAPAEIATALQRNWMAPPVLRFVIFWVALTLAVVMIPLTSGLGFDSLAGWNLHHAWAVANNAALFYLMFEGFWLAVESWRTIGRYMRRHVSVDLLDRHEIASIGRMGLRSSIVWLGGGTIASSMSWGMSQAAPLFIMLTVLLAFATLSLLLPALMARGTLRDAKLAELERVRAKIAHAREAVLSGGAAAAEQAAVLQGLLAYEVRIESVREWPYDPPTLIRFGVFAVIAAGSWLGGALVERALSAVLD